MDEFYVIAVLVATFLVTIVAGFLVAFALIVMPGIAKLSNRDFIRAFQEMDGIIQRGHPLFILIWIGSVASLLVAIILAWWAPGSEGRYLLGIAAAIYLSGVQLPTVLVNIPLNNQIQSIDTQVGDESLIEATRHAFEKRWNQWNVFRTILACGASIIMLVVTGTVL